MRTVNAEPPARTVARPRHLVWVTTLACVAVTGCREILGPKPNHLLFDVQPANGLAGVALLPIALSVRDPSGGLEIGSSGVVALSVIGGTLIGDTTAAVSGGFVRFTNLRIALSGANYVLVATSGSLRAVSTPFRVSNPAQRIAFVGASIYVANVDGSGSGALLIDTTATRGTYGRPARSEEH